MYRALLILHYLASSVGEPCRSITYGSAIKLKNTDYQVRLQSPNLKYSRGSQQQIVTCINSEDDTGSHWLVKPRTAIFTRGRPVKCGDIIRLEHLNSKTNLHSHKFDSPLSGLQEISAFGVDGLGDEGDYWKLICSNDIWVRGTQVSLKHSDTDVYLALTGMIHGGPLDGHYEVVGMKTRKSATWVDEEGLYVHSGTSKRLHDLHDEL